MHFRRLRILGYHNVGNASAIDPLPQLYVTAADFERQMGLLQRLGLRGVTLTQGLASLREGKRLDCVAITFDDGYADNLQLALPILLKFGFQATCYFVSRRLGLHNTWDAERGGAHKALMSIEQLQQWQAAGMEVGSHTATHIRLDQLDRVLAPEEIDGSRAQLKQITGSEIAGFCYPFGRYDERTLAQVRAAGYRSAATTRPGAASRSSDPFQLPRIFVGNGCNRLKFAAKLLLAR